MTELNTISLNDFVKLATVIWIKGATSVKNYMRDSGMVREMTIPENTGNTREFSEIDTNEYLSYKGQGDQAARGKVQQGYSKTMTAYRVAENIGITYEMRTQNKYPEVVSQLLNGGMKGPNTIDLDLSLRLSFGASTSYTDRDGRTIDTTVGDGYQLFYTAHTLAGSPTTFRNRLANNPRLSKGALEAIERQAIENTYNHLGEKKTIPFDILWTTDDPNTVNTAQEYLKSVASPEATHAGVTNVYAGKYKHVVLPRVALTATGAPDTTKRYYWGIASSQLTSFMLGIWEAPHMIPPTEGSNGEDVQTDNSQLSLLGEILIEKFRKFREHLNLTVKTILSQARLYLEGATTIDGTPFGVMRWPELCSNA